MVGNQFGDSRKLWAIRNVFWKCSKRKTACQQKTKKCSTIFQDHQLHHDHLCFGSGSSLKIGSNKIHGESWQQHLIFPDDPNQNIRVKNKEQNVTSNGNCLLVISPLWSPQKKNDFPNCWSQFSSPPVLKHLNESKSTPHSHGN